MPTWCRMICGSGSRRIAGSFSTINAAPVVRSTSSPTLLRRWTLKSADLDAIRAALGLDHVAILGDSYGGMIAMAYAAAHPEHVSRLVLSDSGAP